MPNPENIEPYKMKPGETLNPAGRPKGSRNLSTILKEMLDEEIEVNIDGIKSRKQFKEVIIRKLLKKANEGDLRAIQEIFDRVEGKAKQEIEQSGGIKIQFADPGDYIYPSQDQSDSGIPESI